MKNIKVVAVGDGAIGKTSLLLCYSCDVFPSSYIPTVFDNYCKNTFIENVPCSLQLWDTAGQEDYKRTRPLTYPGTDVFLLCFSLDNMTSLENIEYMWIPEIREFCPDTPFVLLGTKKDIRDSYEVGDQQTVASLNQKNFKPVSTNVGKAFAEKHGFISYFEVSALKGENVSEAFEGVGSIALHKDELIKKDGDTLQGQTDVNCACLIV